jgi:hypothetical protein
MHTRINEMSTLLLLFDLILTQAIERYEEMKPDEIRRAIRTEWKDQTAVLLRGFFFKPGRKGLPELRHRARRDGNGVYIEPRRSHKVRHSFIRCHR